MPRIRVTFRAELRAMVHLALPIVVVQLGQMLMGVADTVMVGHVSAKAIAAVAVARAVQRGLVLALGLSVVAMALLLPARPVLGLLHQPAWAS